MKLLLTLLILATASLPACATPKSVRVFIALCDNKTQGIIPVGEKIGNGDKPDDNLYWGCTDGFGSYFRRSRNWKVLQSEKDVSPEILRRMKLRHVGGEIELTAEAYRGSAMKQCLIDFEQAVASGRHALVAYIGHNGLMDFSLSETKPPKKNGTDVVVLGCLSEKYFASRIRNLRARPILLTRQLMYPASSILHDVIEQHRRGGTPAEIQKAAGQAYAANQKISLKAATGIFADIQQ